MVSFKNFLKLLLENSNINLEINENFSEYLKIGKDKIAIKYFNQPKNLSEDNTIVLLHEGLGSIEMWKDWPEKQLRSKKNIVLFKGWNGKILTRNY